MYMAQPVKYVRKASQEAFIILVHVNFRKIGINLYCNIVCITKAYMYIYIYEKKFITK